MALVSAATATATVMAVGVEPAQPAAVRVSAEAVSLANAVSLLPTHDKVADVTGGLGTTIYDAEQAFLDQLARNVVKGISLPALAHAAGVDPQSLVTTLLADIPANLLPGLIATITKNLPIPIVGPVLHQLNLDFLTPILTGLGVDDITDGTLTGLLALIGLKLSNPLNLSDLNVPGLNLVTTGPTFSVLKILGLDLGWVPGQPNSVANAINGSPYLDAGANGVLNYIVQQLNGPLKPVLDVLPLPIKLSSILSQLTNLLGAVTGPIPDLIDVRVVPTVGVGLGAFAAAMAYQHVVSDLKFQPGGSAHKFGTASLLGSLTILPMVLLNNPGRPDGGLFARFGAAAALLGINTVNPTTHATSDNGILPVGNTGLSLGGANVLPIMIDATYEYQTLSDFASWPDVFTLVNNVAAALSPTYMLRGLDVTDLPDQLASQLTGATAGAPANQLALNLYLTLHSSTLPMLEPLYLASDALKIVGLQPLAAFARHLANALAPALTTLVNMGYADAIQNPDGTIDRNVSTAGTETPFLSFADINYGKALGDSVNQLVKGIQKEFFSGTPTAATPNILAELLKGANPLDKIGDLLGGLLNGIGLNPPAATATTLSKTVASAVPSANARLLSLTPDPSNEPSDAGTVESKDTSSERDSTTDTAPDPKTADTIDVKDTPTSKASDTKASDTKDAGETTPAKTATGPKHAKPEADSAPAATDQSTAPKHAKADEPTSTDAGVTKAPKHAKRTSAEGSAAASGAGGSSDKAAA